MQRDHASKFTRTQHNNSAHYESTKHVKSTNFSLYGTRYGYGKCGKCTLVMCTFSKEVANCFCIKSSGAHKYKCVFSAELGDSAIKSKYR